MEENKEKTLTLEEINHLNTERLKVYEFNGLSEVLKAGVLSYFNHRANKSVMQSAEISIMKESAKKLQKFVNKLCY